MFPESLRHWQQRGLWFKNFLCLTVNHNQKKAPFERKGPFLQKTTTKILDLRICGTVGIVVAFHIGVRIEIPVSFTYNILVWTGYKRGMDSPAVFKPLACEEQLNASLDIDLVKNGTFAGGIPLSLIHI